MDVKETSNHVPSGYVEKMSRIYEEWRESDLSLKAFCETRDEVTYSQLHYFRMTYRPEDIQQERPTGWAKINMQSPTTQLDLHVGPYKVVIHPGFDKELLTDLLEVITP